MTKEPMRVQVDDFDVLLETFIAEIRGLAKNFNDNSGKVDVRVEMKKDTEAFVNALEAIKKELSQKVEAIKIPEFPAFPEPLPFPKTISIDEAQDIIDVLKKVLEQVKKNAPQSFKGVEQGLERILKAIPVIPELPMENGRIKVILPDDQVLPMRTDLGKKVKQSTGQFVGGMTINPNITLKDLLGNQINPAKEDGNLSTIKDSVAKATTPAIATKTLTLADTTYPYTIPDGTLELSFKLRAFNSDLKYSWDNFANYFTLLAGGTKTLKDVILTGKTIYFQCADAAQVVEIETLI